MFEQLCGTREDDGDDDICSATRGVIDVNIECVWVGGRNLLKVNKFSG